MTVTSEVSSIFYYGNTNDPQTFEVPFYFLANSNLVVSKSDGITKVDLFETTDYTVSGADNLNGGSITMVYTDSTNDHRIGASEKITIERTLPVTQEVDFITGGQFRAETQEQGLDRIVMILQQILRGGINLSSMPHNLLADLGIHEAGHTWKINDINSVSRNLYDKFMEMRRISVMDFGAVGDGVTDDTIAIKAAISFCLALGGGEVIFPPARYLITDTLVIDGNNISITGSSPGGNNGDNYRPLKPYYSNWPIVRGNTVLIWGGIDGGTMVQIAPPIVPNPVGAPDSYGREINLSGIKVENIELLGWNVDAEPPIPDGSTTLVPSQPIAGTCLDLIALRSCEFKNITMSYTHDACLLLRAASPQWVSDGSGGFVFDELVNNSGFRGNLLTNITCHNLVFNVDQSQSAYMFGTGIRLTREGSHGGADCFFNIYKNIRAKTIWSPAVDMQSADSEYFNRLVAVSINGIGLLCHGISDSTAQAQGFNTFGSAKIRIKRYNGSNILLCGTDTDNPLLPGTSYSGAARSIMFVDLDQGNGTLPPFAGAGVNWSMIAALGGNVIPAANGMPHYNMMLGSRLNALFSGIGGKEQIVGWRVTSSSFALKVNNWIRVDPGNHFTLHWNGIIKSDETGLTDNKTIILGGCGDINNNGEYNILSSQWRLNGITTLLSGALSADDTCTDVTIHPQVDWDGWNHSILLLDATAWMNPVKFIDSSTGCQAGTFIIKQNSTGDGIWPGWDAATAAKMIWLNGVEPQGLATMPANNGVIISISYSESIGKYLCQYSTIIDMS